LEQRIDLIKVGIDFGLRLLEWRCGNSPVMRLNTFDPVVSLRPLFEGLSGHGHLRVITLQLALQRNQAPPRTHAAIDRKGSISLFELVDGQVIAIAVFDLMFATIARLR
jgi:hypothetical protein